MNNLGYHGEIRDFITDNKNLIYDIHLDSLRDHPEEDHAKLIDIPGVVETGFFFNMATDLIVGKSDGQTEETTF